MKRLNLNTDKNLTENSNILASSQQALKYYIDQKRVLLNYLQATEPTSFSINEKWLNTSSNKIFTALSSSTWDNGIDLESGQIYSFNNLLYHWDGENLLIYSSGSITETNNNTEVKTWVGTQSEYDAIVTKDPTTEYSITDAYSNLDIVLATQVEFNNSSTTKAATPYQVNQKMGNYLPLAGGNLNAGAILRLTNTNNEVTPLAFDISGYLTVGSKLYVNTETNTNTLVVRSGNIYKIDTSGDTVVWSNDLDAYLPLTGGTLTGDLFIQGSNNKLFGFKRTNSNTNIDIGWDWASNAGSGAAFRSVDATASQGIGNFYIWARNGSGTTSQLIGTPAGSLTWSNSEVQTAAKKGVANGLATLDANIKIPASQLPLATVSTLGAVQPDGTTITINNGVISASGASGAGVRSIGEIVPSILPLTDAGLHLLDGALISGSGMYSAFVTYIAGLVSSYPNLFVTESAWQTSVTTYGVCGKFVYDSTNNTVRLPKITGIMEGTIDATALGDLVQAGLPNITGSATTYLMNEYPTFTGALASGSYVGAWETITGANPGILDRRGLTLDASNSSSVYGNSNTVQPQTIKGFYYIVVANSTKTEVEVDIDHISTDVNGKADTDLSNVTNTGTSTAAGWAMPSDIFDTLTLGASETLYTAPANGFFTLKKAAGITGSYYLQVELYNENDTFIAPVYWFDRPSVTTECAVFFVSVKKGQKIKVTYTINGITYYFRFVYAEGSKLEAN